MHGTLFLFRYGISVGIDLHQLAQRPTESLTCVLIGVPSPQTAGGPPSHIAINRRWGPGHRVRGSLPLPPPHNSNPNRSRGAASDEKSTAGVTAPPLHHRISTPLLLHLLQPVWSATSTLLSLSPSLQFFSLAHVLVRITCLSTNHPLDPPLYDLELLSISCPSTPGCCSWTLLFLF
jgi:hypothetical protein